MADCKTLPCCNSGSLYLYSLSNAGLYGNPLVPIPGGGVVVYPPPGGGPGLLMDVTSACCDGSASVSTIFVPVSPVAFQISIQCCNGSSAGGLITPGMTADQIQAIGLTMAIACTNSNECPPDPNNPNPPPPGGPGGPFLVKLTCCDGLVVVGTVQPAMTTIQISELAANLVAQCAARKVFCTAPPNPEDPQDHPNPDVYYPGLKAGNDPQTIPLCSDSTTLSAPDGLPSWASISGNNLTIAANQFFVVPASTLPSDIAAAKTLANTQALAFLNSFAATAITTGFLTCSNPLTLAVWYLPDDEIPFTGAAPRGMASVLGLLYTAEFNVVRTSPDGLNYTQISSALPNSGNGIAYGLPVNALPPDPIFAICGVGTGGKVIATSPDAIVWTEKPLTSAEFYTRIAFGAGRFITTSDLGKAAFSDDGANWAEVSTGATSFNGLAYGSVPNVFVAVGNGGDIFTTADGVTWTPQTSGTAQNLNDVTYDNGVFLAVGRNGTMLTSPNGVTWTLRTGGETNHILACSGGGGYFVTNGRFQDTWSSADGGVTWTLFRVGGALLAESYGSLVNNATFVFSQHVVT